MEQENPEAVAVFVSAESDSAGMRKEYFDHVRKINDVFYDQIKIADQKAAYIFTFMIAFLISSSDVRGVFSLRRYAGDDFAFMICSAFLAVAVTVAMISAILVVLPRRSAVSTSLFWGTWQIHRNAFRNAADAADADYLFGEYLTNADTLAAIAGAKYRFVGLAFRSLVVAVLAYVAVLALAP
jgi:hypothetical protein